LWALQRTKSGTRAAGFKLVRALGHN